MKSLKLSALSNGLSSLYQSARARSRATLAAIGFSALFAGCAPQTQPHAHDSGMDARAIQVHTDSGSRRITRADAATIRRAVEPTQLVAPAPIPVVENEGTLFGEHSVLPNGANANPEGGATGAFLEAGMELKDAQRLAHLLNPAMQAARAAAATEARTGHNNDLARLMASRPSGIRTMGTDSVKVFKRVINGVTEYKVEVTTHGTRLWQTAWVNPEGAIQASRAASSRLRSTSSARRAESRRVSHPRTTEHVDNSSAAEPAPSVVAPALAPQNEQARERADMTDLVARLNAHSMISPWLHMSTQEAAVILSRVREDQESKSLQASIRGGLRTALNRIKSLFRSNVA